MPGPPGGDQRDRRGVAEDGGRPLVAEPVGLGVDPGHRPGVDLGRPGQGGRAVGRRAVAGRVERPDVGGVRLQASPAAGAARPSGRTGWGRTGSSPGRRAGSG